MSHKFSRRRFIATTAAGAAAATLRFRAPAIAQGTLFKIGLVSTENPIRID
jgi:hypothetical protein